MRCKPGSNGMRAHVIVRGRVQGVCYRMSAQDEAGRMGLTGWVRNQMDGSVEIMAEGRSGDVREFLLWCREGPPAAHVTHVEDSYSDATGEFSSFRITY